MSFLHYVLLPFKYMRERYVGHPERVAIAAAKTLLVAHVFSEYCYSVSPTWGASMLPTFEVLGDSVLISKRYRRGRGIRVGDVVAFDSVVEPGESAIKRVLGLQGDYVMRDSLGKGSDAMLQVPEGHCWVVGDNLDYSRDSRLFGPMPMGLIKGKVLAVVFPWDERRWITNSLTPVHGK